MEIEFFTFSLEAIQISKLDENEAKHDKSNDKRGLTVPLEINKAQNQWKN